MGYVYTTTEGMTKVVLEKERRRWNARANDPVIVGVAKGAITRMEIRDVIDQLANEYPRRIIYNPKVAAGLAAVRAAYPTHRFGNYAVENILLDQCEYLKFDIENPQDLLDVGAWMIGNKKVDLSPQGVEQQQFQANAKQEAERRFELLFSILDGRKTTYPEWSPKHGQVRYIDAHTLESKTNEELQVIESEVSALRRRMGMDRSGQREDLHQFANTNRVGYDDKGNKIVGFENRPKTASLDAPAVRPYSNDKSAISIRVEARQGETARAVSHNGTATPSDPFINPTTQHEYTKKEIYSLAKNDLKTFRALMKKDQNRLNRIIS